MDPCRGAKSSTENGRSTVTINQTADRAILNWQTFNVGRDTTVDFRQQAEWAVLNRVNDPAGRPSQIQGQIKAPGTVLIVNRNGVVFDGASQVNVRNLVAAAGRISDEQFRERGLYGAQGSEPSFTDALGKVEVRPGARIDTHAPGSVTQGGGYVLLLGGEVHNAGAISARAGRRSLPPATASSGAAWAPARTPCRPRGATRSRRAWRRTRMAAWYATPA